MNKVIVFISFLIHSCAYTVLEKDKLYKERMNNIRYAVFNLGSLDNIEFFIPDTSKIPTNCNKIKMIESCLLYNKEKSIKIKNNQKKTVSQNLNMIFKDDGIEILNEDKEDNITVNEGRESYEEMKLYMAKVCEKIPKTDIINKCIKEKFTCARYFSVFYNISPKIKRETVIPLYSMRFLEEKYPDYQIKINTMINSIFGYKDWFAKMPCIALAGKIKTLEGKILGQSDLYLPLDTMIIYPDKKNKIMFKSFSEVNTNDLISKSGGYVQGITIIRKNKFVRNHRIFKNHDALNRLKKAYRCFAKNGRTLLGVNKLNELLLTYVSNKEKHKYGATCEEIATILATKYQVT